MENKGKEVERKVTVNLENMVKLGEELMAQKMKEGVAKAEAEELVKRMKTHIF